MKVCRDSFCLVVPDGVVLWDYRLHQQFTLDCSEANALLADPQGFASQQDFEWQGSERDAWRWDEPSWIFHVGTRDLPEVHSELSPEEYAER